MKPMPPGGLMAQRRRKLPAHPLITTKPDGIAKLTVFVPGGRVTIEVAKVTAMGEPCSTIQVDADGDRYDREKPWWIEGRNQVRSTVVRVIARKPTLEDEAREEQP